MDRAKAAQRHMKKQAIKLERMKRLRTAQAIVRKGVCPDCGTKLIRNNSMYGWYQCGGYASPGFRQPGFEDAAKCSFQTFYDPSSAEVEQLIEEERGFNKACAAVDKAFGSKS